MVPSCTGRNLPSHLYFTQRGLEDFRTDFLGRKVYRIMSETVQIIFGLILLVAVYVFTQAVVGWRIRRASKNILRDLDFKKAFDPATAIELPYAKRNIFRIGLRDFRPKAVQALVQAELVGMTAAGKYYLKKRLNELKL
jgi:hypothetical protein